MMHIVDDSTDVLDIMSELVQAFGFRAHTFHSAMAYLHYASSEAYVPPVAVLADMGLPDINGMTLMFRVQAMHPEVRFIIMSEEDHKACPVESGACIYLRKPIRFDRLETTFRHLHACAQEGPSPFLAGTLRDDRSLFGVQSVNCPLLPGEED